MNKTELTDIQKINLKNNIDVNSLAEKRKSIQVSMHLLAEVSSCSSSDYSDYENEKKAVQRACVQKCCEASGQH